MAFTIELDRAAYELLRKAKRGNESWSAVIRRLFAPKRNEVGRVDAADNLDALFKVYGGKGLLTSAARARLVQRQKFPPRSPRPSRVKSTVLPRGR